MWIVAVDPGETIGLAVYNSDSGIVSCAEQTSDPLYVADVLGFFKAYDSVVVIESFPGGGPRTTAAIHTLKVLGFVEYYARHLGLTVVLQVPQMRKHKLQEARQLIDQKDVHATDALAHALAYAATRVKHLSHGVLTKPV